MIHIIGQLDGSAQPSKIKLDVYGYMVYLSSRLTSRLHVVMEDTYISESAIESYMGEHIALEQELEWLIHAQYSLL